MADLPKVVHFTNVRLSFPNLVTAQVTKGDDGSDRVSYNAAFLMPPNHPDFAKFWQVVQLVAQEKWKEQAQAVLAHVQQSGKRCWAAGEEKVNSKTFKPYDGYPGNIVISAGNKVMPQMIDAQGAVTPPENTMACQAIARKMYAGCRVNVALKPWPQQNTKAGNGIRCELVAVQFHSDDTPFGEGHVDVTGMFAPTEATPAAPGFAAAPWSPPGAFGAPATAPPAFGAPAAAPVWAAPATAKPSFL